MNTDLDLNQLLKKYFGFNSFRDNQLHIIKSIVSENNNLVIICSDYGIGVSDYKFENSNKKLTNGMHLS